MSDRQRYFTIHARRDVALWPGQHMVCVRLTAPKFLPSLYYLVKQDGEVGELAEYRYGMLREVERRG